MPSASRSSVAQFSVSAIQLIKLIKSVSSLVLKKKSHCYSLRFLRKAPTKNYAIKLILYLHKYICFKPNIIVAEFFKHKIRLWQK